MHGGQIKMVDSPSFFIVGAPKAGTTSLNDYLAQYPDIFIPAAKEMHFFGTDLEQKKRKEAKLTREAYLSHFADITDEVIAGEASVLYLKSETAAQEIRDFCPDARIIVMLRQPAELIHSLHSQLISQGDEDVKDFGAALELEQERKAGRSLPKGVKVPDDGLFYRDVARLGSQLERYLDIFPSEQVHVIFFEDFSLDPQAEVDKVRAFLGLPPGIASIDTSVRNPASRPRSRLLTRFLYHPPGWAIALTKRLAPRATLIALRDRIRRFNDVKAQRIPPARRLHDELTREFETEIAKLEALTGRDLRKWRVADSVKHPQISAVIPCYNCADTIERAVDSVLNQTTPVAEIILVNDASLDNSAAVLQQLAGEHENIQVITLAQNSGPSHARNTGWETSQSDWVAFLDADDAWHPEKIAIQLQIILQQPKLALIGHGCEVGEPGQSWTDFSTLDDANLSEKVRLISRWRLILSNPWPTPSVMLRRDLPQRFDTDMRRAEDYLLWARIVMGGGVGARINLNLGRLYKPKYGVAGLSADLRASEEAELEVIRRLRRAQLIPASLAIGWSAFSLAKHLRRLAKTR
jgi:hypothetical protein